MVNLSGFHKLLVDRWAKLEALLILQDDPDDPAYGTTEKPFPLIVWAGGRNPESPELPYLQYDLLFETKYPSHSVFKHTDETTPGLIETHYKNPSSEMRQYAIIGNADDKHLRKKITLLYNYMTTAGFKEAMKVLKVSATLMSPINELILNRQECLTRRFFFDVRLNYSDNFTEDETSIGVIETADDPERVPADSEL